MKLAHNIKLSVFSYESDGEDTEKIAKALSLLCPFDLKTEKLTINRTSAQGFKERKIIILDITLSKERHTKKILQHLKDSLSEEHINLIKSQIDSRLDEELNFFIRLDKQKLIQDKEFYLTDSGNCFHIRMSIAAYPSNRENAMDVVADWLQ